ncbi:hypothetical protein DAEQUDRAFT_431616 [Daedalea quercina L-15889]|uniref:Uncharacterized protein n=1 Tax=Daedalea quercina L-15889 TaxID=1314783 RepID=A0A165NFZ6_9APHY|nr:hypothetical protein DAEQUDRAFT_431616 [Daedalea quercina L-15889]
MIVSHRQCPLHNSTYIAPSPGVPLISSKRHSSSWYGPALAYNGSPTMRACTGGGDISVHNRRIDPRTRQWAQRCAIAGRAPTAVGTVPPATHHAVVAGYLGLKDDSFRADSTYQGCICPVGLLRGFIMRPPRIIRILDVETWPARRVG